MPPAVTPSFTERQPWELLTYSTILVCAVYKKARQALTSLQRCWLRINQKSPSPCRVQESKTGTLDLNPARQVNQPQAPVTDLAARIQW